jgi:predicted RNA-binding Zn-ribbon protein involved in translation (DUF1610 family)
MSFQQYSNWGQQAAQPPAQSQPSSSELKLFPGEHLTQFPCKDCSGHIIIKAAAKGDNQGRQYYRCINTHGCKVTKNTWKGWVDEGDPVSIPSKEASSGSGQLSPELIEILRGIDNKVSFLYERERHRAPPSAITVSPPRSPTGQAPPHVADLMQQ